MFLTSLPRLEETLVGVVGPGVRLDDVVAAEVGVGTGAIYSPRGMHSPLIAKEARAVRLVECNPVLHLR